MKSPQPTIITSDKPRPRPVLTLKRAAEPPPAPASSPAPPAPQMLRAELHAKTAACLAALVGRFPNVFMSREKPAPWPPLALGIHKRIVEAAPDVADLKIIRQTLRWYTGHFRYLRGMIEGAARIDLEGRPTGDVVTKDDALFARMRCKAGRAQGAAGRETA